LQAGIQSRHSVRSVRSDCLDWTLVWNERQLQEVLTEYLRHYNTVRPSICNYLLQPAR
jgi:hypothetical protein